MNSKTQAIVMAILLSFALVATGCSKPQPLTLTLAAAASMKNVMEEKVIPLFKEKYPTIEVITTYDASGKLQTQIEEGADIDVFLSAATKQMNALAEKELLLENSVVDLLENKVVLVVPSSNPAQINSFDDLNKANNMAIGDPESVPAGQYAKELLVNLNLWDGIINKTSLGTNVTEVLSWVSEGSADAGIVYSTDAASTENVTVVATGDVSKIIYPVGIIKSTKKKETAQSFIDFLKSDEAMALFKDYGFSAVE